MREPQPTFFPYSRPNLQIEQRHPLNHLRGKLGGRSAEIGNFANNLWAAAYENHSTICGVAAKAMRVDMGSADRYDDERKAIMELASFVRSNELWMGWSVVTLMWCQLLDFGIPSWAGCLLIFFSGIITGTDGFNELVALSQDANFCAGMGVDEPQATVGSNNRCDGWDNRYNFRGKRNSWNVKAFGQNNANGSDRPVVTSPVDKNRKIHLCFTLPFYGFCLRSASAWKGVLG